MTDKKCDSGSSCPVSSKIGSTLCMINKLMHIIVFIALAMVLFDIHGMLKAQKEYANAVTAAVANSQANQAGQMAAGPQA